jgi:hypothetical protein
MIKRALGTFVGWVLVVLLIPPLWLALLIWEHWPQRLRRK